MTLKEPLSTARRQICSKCIYDERVGGISFDEDGECNYCKQIDGLALEYGTGTQKGKEKFIRFWHKPKKTVRTKSMIVL